MNRLTTIAAAATCVAFQVTAQTVPLGHLERVDADNDGAVTRSEFDSFAATAFQMLDTNSDGALSAAELQGHLEGGSIADLDEDGNGMVSRPEFGRRMSANFAAADRDGNGVID